MNIRVEQQTDKDIAVLRWKVEEGSQLSLYLHRGEVVDIGRQTSNDLQLMNPRISRQHAVVVWREESFHIKDLDSLNGVFVNKEKVTGFRKLNDGDMIHIDTESLYFYQITAPISAVKQPELHSDTIIVPKRLNQPRLVIVSGDQESRQIMLRSDKLVIGRSSAKDVWDISIQDKAISRPHAEISQEGKKIIIADLKSANGTLINGNWITEPIVLENGDLVELGETILLFRDR
ncbi:MAG: FHA domain-containing protein [Anaerolineaceae bacterium]|nr:FHA domain-containing protein [Anaerolineaceae bacterium]